MSELSQVRAYVATNYAQPIRRANPQMGGGQLAAVARVLWPENTVAHLAAAAGISVGSAEHCLYGSRKWNAAALAAIFAALASHIAD